MTDVLSPAKRSKLMSRIRPKNTGPELILRRLLHASGFRYRLHDHKLPGTPDIVLPKYKTVVQVRGCFWHYHTCIDGHVPKTNTEYWAKKLAANQLRDRKTDAALKALGWKVFIIWECDLGSGLQNLVDALKAG
jgi:DNA mismatch endonuclease, patch repair protein